MIFRWLSKACSSLRAAALWLARKARRWWHSQTVRYRIRARAGDRYRSVQPLLTKPQDYETFIRLGHVEMTIRAGGQTFKGIDAAPAARRLWEENLLFGDPDLKYKLEGGETVSDPGEIVPGAVIEEIQMQNTVRVPDGFLTSIGPST